MRVWLITNDEKISGRFLTECGFAHEKLGSNVRWFRPADDQAKHALGRLHVITAASGVYGPGVSAWLGGDTELKEYEAARRVITGETHVAFESKPVPGITLKDSQIRSIQTTLGLTRVQLFSETGTGKTAVNAIAIENALKARPGKKWIIVCKRILIRNAHLKDIATFTDLKAVTLHPGSGNATTNKKVIEAIKDGTNQVYIISNDLLGKQWAMLRHQWGLDAFLGMTIDEAQYFLTPASNRFEQASIFIGEADPTYRIVMTGTPYNKAYQAWSYLALIGEMPYSWEHWRSNFAYEYREPIARGAEGLWRDHKGAAYAIEDYCRFFTIKATKESLNLPTMSEQVIRFQLNETERGVMQQMLESYCSMMADGREILAYRGLAAFLQSGTEATMPESMEKIAELSSMIKLRQMCSGFAYDPMSQPQWFGRSKFDQLLALLKCHPEEKIVIACEFQETIAVLFEYFSSPEFFAGRTPPMPVKLDGTCSDKQQDEAVFRFQNDPTCRMLIGHPKSMGEGLTLTAATVVISYEPSWSYLVTKQVQDRIHRLGQTKPTTYYRLVAQNTIEQVMYQVSMGRRWTHKITLSTQARSFAPVPVEVPTAPKYEEDLPF